ncbi:MAG: universal stress protein [Nitrospinota bacterium]|nr:MAG: universal stress protein [Nitrospinota bacterium]
MAHDPPLLGTPPPLPLFLLAPPGPISLKEERRERVRSMKFLICYDGKEYSEQALRFGGKVAKRLDADVSVLYVQPPVSSFNRDELAIAHKKLSEWEIDLPGVRFLKRAQEILLELDVVMRNENGEAVERHPLKWGIKGAFETHYLGYHGQNIRLRLREGEVAEEILKEAEENAYDLVITGSRGHRGLYRFFLGSVAQRVAQFAPCSVLVAKNIKEDDNVLICTDGSPGAEKAEHWGLQIARALGAEVTILSVAENEEKEESARHCTERVQKLLADFQLSGKQKVRVGRPSEVIIEEAEDHDIVVLGASRRTGVSRFLLGSVPLKVSAYGLCPVLIVR